MVEEGGCAVGVVDRSRSFEAGARVECMRLHCIGYDCTSCWARDVRGPGAVVAGLVEGGVEAAWPDMEVSVVVAVGCRVDCKVGEWSLSLVATGYMVGCNFVDWNSSREAEAVVVGLGFGGWIA